MDLGEFGLLLAVELLGAAAGVFIGYMHAINQERKLRKDAETEEKKKIIESLLQEIHSNEALIEKGMEPREILRGEHIQGFWDFLSDPIYEGIKFSGKLNLLSVETQLIVSSHYNKIRRMNDSTQTLLHQIQDYPIRVEGTITSIQMTLTALSESLPQIKKVLEDDLALST